MSADRDRDRWNRRDRHEDDRGFWERAGDEVRSWFGDEDDDRRYMEGGYRGGRGYGGEGRSREDAGYGGMRGRGDMERGRHGDYGQMARSGRGWSGGERSDWADRMDSPWRGDRSGSGAGGRYGPGFSERYGSGEWYGGEESGRSGRSDFGGSAGQGAYGIGPEGYGGAGAGRYGSMGQGGSRGRGFGRQGGREGGQSYGQQEHMGSDRYGTSWGASDWQEQSARRGGQFAGRGPSGYKRSAERITEDVNEALTWDGDVDASQIQVRVEGDEVILEGTVDSRRAKRAAEEAAERVRGVSDVHNRLRVEARQDDSGWSSVGQAGQGQSQSSRGGSGQSGQLSQSGASGSSSQRGSGQGASGSEGSAQDSSRSDAGEGSGNGSRRT